MSGPVRVAAWWALLLALGWVCIASLLDRSARQGVLAAAPPALLGGGNATMVRAWAAYDRGDMAAAWALSREAVRQRPIDAPALRIAGLTALAQGDARHGDALLRLAGAAGWRDVPTQLYWAEVALDTGAAAVAAARLDAVARTGQADAATPLLHRLEATTAGRAALAARLRQPAAWAPAYLADVAGLDAGGLAARSALVEALGADRSTRNRVAEALIARGQSALAWRMIGGARQPVPPFRGGETGPFDWTLAAAPGLDTMVERGSLLVHASGPALLPIASVLVRLPAGPAHLSGRIAGHATPMPLIVGLVCVDGEGASAETDVAPAGRFAARLLVPPGCAMQRLTLAVTGEEARRGAELTIGDPAITPGAAGP